MSKPENILAKYRTYSYHHVLIACDNEAAADFIRTSNRVSVFRDLSLSRAVTQDDTTKKVDVDDIEDSSGKVNRTKIGSYVVILNGMIDTSFVITDVEWFSATAANAEANDAFTSLAVEGKMTVEEPRGVRFLNALNGACDLLESDPTGVIWMLKTIFIGHNDDGSSSDYITDLRPLEFMMYDVTGTFSISGGVYEISFAGVSNGASRYPQFSRIAQNITIPLSNGGKLNDAMTSLTAQMNSHSSQNRTCVLDTLRKSYPQANEEELQQFRQVWYAVVLDDVYDKDEYKIDTFNNSEKDVATEDNPGGVIKPGPNTSIEQAIRNIMQRSTRVLKDRTEGDGTYKYIFKIHSEITMVGKEATGPEALTNVPTNTAYVAVVYHIRRHAEMTNQTVQTVLEGGPGTTGDPSEITPDRIRENTVEFDYFFTGKNTDILDFDLKMDMGLAFLQTVSSTNNIGTGTYQISGTEIEDLNENNNNVTAVIPNENVRGDPAVGTEGEKKEKVFIRSKTPIFPATNIRNVMTKNVRGALDATLFNAFLSRHAALESIEATVTIHGNPYMMSSTNRKPSDTARRGNTSDEGDVTNVLSNWEYMPGLARVNIYMPRNNDTPSSSDTFIRDRFWYDGYYYIYGIDHKFNDGQFTQNLHLLSLPNKSLIEDKQETDVTLCGVQEEAGSEDTSAQSSDAAEGTTEGVSIKESTGKAKRKPQGANQGDEFPNLPGTL